MNRGFLLTTSSQESKIHAVESQITLFDGVYHLQKNNTQLIAWSFLIIESVSFTSAAFDDFAEANLWFLVSALT